MNTVILGAGAMGCSIGALLKQAGADVTLVDVWKEAVDKINADGLRVDDKAGNAVQVRLRAVTEAKAAPGPVDLVIVFVKCYHTEEAIRAALPIIGPGTTVLSLQNGWGNGPRIAEIVGREKLLIGVCYHSATVLAPGHVLHAGRGKTYVGELDGVFSPRLKAVTDLFTKAGIDVDASNQVLKEIWSKLALNCVSLATSALTRVTADQQFKLPAMEEVCRGLLREVIAVANARGIPLDFDERWAAITGLHGKLAPGTKGSMLQDVEKRRQTEIDVINGAILTAGRELNIPTPYNHALYCLIKCHETTFQ
ncbi:ketopantoate reductase family protein [Nibricoccus sp. IMCC34717]|uniref:ketopantoate reductase family protein n=1 Tax=Nibricoccus sp. IMCC34717 TaxID=3034021 RepID=UPI00384ACCE2